MSEYVERLFYRSVSAASSQNDDYVVPSGKTLNLTQVGGNASAVPSTEVAIIWDPAGANELIYMTHGDGIVNIASKNLAGNGTKVLRIRLINDQLSSDSLGGFWKGQLYNA